MGSWRSRALGAAAGLLADAVVGEPPAAVHPVARFGQVMTVLERHAWRDGAVAGMGYAAAGIGGAAAAGVVLARLAPPGAATAVACATVTAGRMLARQAMEIAARLDGGDLDGARAVLPALVGRDPFGLDEKEIARAVVESVAENTVDAVVAPALWAAAGGPPAAFAYRAVNTLDAMVGHRTVRYERFGAPSARLDDAANWVPARITAAAVALCRPAAARALWQAVRRDAPRHPSPNAGVAEAAFAAALGVRLGGPSRYGGRLELRPPLGTGRPPEPGDIRRAVGLSRQVSAVVAGALVLAAHVPAVARRRTRRVREECR